MKHSVADGLTAVTAILLMGSAALAQSECVRGYWESRAGMIDARHQTACATWDDLIYVAGDYNVSPIFNRFEVYDPRQDKVDAPP